MSEWQPASTTAQREEDEATGSSSGSVVVSVVGEPPKSAGRLPRLASTLPSWLTMPTGTSLSVVRVPVLSKRMASILPAVGTRKGSVHMMPDLISAMSAVLTASAVCMGKWRGTTEVTMMTHLRRSSCVVRSPFSRPRRKTKKEAASANTSRMRRAIIVSTESSLTFCCENSIIIISSP